MTEKVTLVADGKLEAAIISSEETKEKDVLRSVLSSTLISEWDHEKNREFFPNLNIYNAKPKSQKKVWWLCSKNHSYDASLRHRTEGSKCPICSNRTLLTGYNDFATKNPDLIEKWNMSGTNPDPSSVLYATSLFKVSFPCEKGHYYEISPEDLSKGRRCNYCAGIKILIGFNDLAHKAPDSITWWDYEKNDKTPYEVRYGSVKKVWWKCPKAHEYRAAIDKFAIGRRCSVCAGKIADLTTNLLATHPELTKEWHPTKNSYGPETISKGHDKKVWWKCIKCSAEWDSTVTNRTKPTRPQGCPQCARGQTSSKGENQIFEFLKENGAHDIIQHKRFQGSKKRFELDMLIPSKRVAIEFNGVYYHSERFVDADYHKAKYEECRKIGIRLIQIWEDEWFNGKREAVKNFLLNEISLNDFKSSDGIDQSQIQEISLEDALRFHEENNILKNDPQSEPDINFGIYEGSSLIAVISLKETEKGNTLDILRYSTNKIVQQGFATMLEKIEKTHSFEKFTATTDNCTTDRNFLESIGFVAAGENDPSYKFLVKKQYREDESMFNLERFKTDPQLRYKDDATLEELFKLNNMLKIYDAGRTNWVRYVSK